MGNNGKGLLALMCCVLLMLAMPLSVSASGGTEIEAKYNIQITAPVTPQGDSAFVTVALEDVNGTGFVTAEARLGQDGDWLDITGELRAHGMAAVEVRGNGVFYVAVTDHTGYAHVQAEAVECFSGSAVTSGSTTAATTQSAIPSGTPDSNPFTPEGTGTVLDNATGDDEKEFFTITTADENVFYLIVDRQRYSENVYFLNAVTEEDLLSLAQPGSSGNASVIPVEEPEPAPQPDPEPDPEPEAEAKKSNSGSLLFIIIAVAGVGGAGYYFKILKPRQEAADSVEDDEDEYDDYDDAYPDDEPDYPDEDGDPADDEQETEESE